MEPEKNITNTATKMTMLAEGSKNTNNDGTDEDGTKEAHRFDFDRRTPSIIITTR
jgi:hypothetical protein